MAMKDRKNPAWLKWATFIWACIATWLMFDSGFNVEVVVGCVACWFMFGLTMDGGDK